MKMRYSIFSPLKYRKYVKGYGFLSFARKFGHKYGKKLMDTATKTGIDLEKLLLSQQFNIRDKIANKITSLSKTKSKEKEHKRQEMYMP